MSTSRVMLAFASALFLGVFMMGGMKNVLAMFDMAFELQDMPYVLAIPGMAAFTLYMLRV